MDKILLLSPVFYNYWSIIKAGIEDKGYHVDTIVYPKNFVYDLCSIIPSLHKVALLYEQKYFNDAIERLSSNRYEKVIVIKSSLIPDNVLKKLKNVFSSSCFISYLWDDLSIDTKEKNHICLFDKVYSFSLDDCEKYNFHYRPMFYNDRINYVKTNKTVDLLYIGSYKSNRYEFVKKLLSLDNIKNSKCIFILRTSFFMFMTKLEHFNYYKYFKFTPVSYENMMEIMQKTKCAIELQHHGQTGLTTRPIECIPTRTKIITTNKSITKYSLYNENNVLIIDENNPDIPLSWINLPYIELKDDIKNFYSLTNFVNDLLS